MSNIDKELNLETFVSFLDFVLYNFFFDSSFLNLKIYFVRLYWFIKQIYFFNLYNNVYIFYFFCHFFKLSFNFIHFFKAVSAKLLYASDLKFFLLFNIIYKFIFFIRNSFFFYKNFNFKIVKYNRFVLRVDLITFMVLRFKLEWFRVFKYNEYINYHYGLSIFKQLRGYLRIPDPQYNYTVPIYIKYKKFFKKNLYVLVNFYYNETIIEYDSEFSMLDLDSIFINFCIFYWTFSRLYFLFFIFLNYLNYIIKLFSYNLYNYCMYYNYIVYLNSYYKYQLDDLVFFFDTSAWRAVLSIVFEDYFYFFGSFYLFCKSKVINDFRNNLCFNSFLITKNVSRFYCNWINGFFYEFLSLFIANFTSKYFLYNFFDLEFVIPEDIVRHFMDMFNTMNLRFIIILNKSLNLNIDLKFSLDVILWEIFMLSFFQSNNVYFFVNLVQALKKTHNDLFLKKITNKLFSFIDLMALEISDKVNDFILNFLFYKVLNDFSLKFSERLFNLRIFYCIDFYSYFYNYIKIINYRKFRYFNIYFHSQLLFFMQKRDTTFI